MTALPEWLRLDAMPPGTPPRAPAGNRALARTLSAIGRALAPLVCDAGSPRVGPIEDADPRAKLVAAAGLIVVATLLHGLPALAACLALALGIAAFAGVPARRLAPVAAVALASALVVLPATLNVVSGGAPFLTVWRPARGTLGPWRLPEAVAVTREGLLVAGRIVLRAAACAALAAVLAATTRPHRLLGGLRALGLPQGFVMVLAMTERYLAVLLQAARELHLARLARTVSALGVRREEAWVAAGVGAVFRRSRALAEEVALAMAARGFVGEVRLLRPARWRGRDWALAAGAVAAAAALLLIDRGAP